MAAAADYIRSFFPLFLLGAVFGKLMEASGAAGVDRRRDRPGVWARGGRSWRSCWPAAC